MVDGPATLEGLRPLVEITLVLVLFSDAARVPVRALRGDAGVYVRLLGVGLPLTVLTGWALAVCCSRGRAGGWPCSSPRRWRRRTRPSVSRW
ncbi:MAG TPA: hypothetical protein VFH03_25110 [Actinoplanes sp.]|nr:hypothetical protein [Actinoplanes sp.]